MDAGWRSLLLFGLSLPTQCAAMLIAIRSADRPASFWLAALLSAWVLLTIPYIIGFAGAYDAFPWLSFSPFNTELWIGPLTYFYVSALVKAPPPAAYWLLPGLIQSAYYSVVFVSLTVAEKAAFNSSFHEPYVVRAETVAGLALGLAGFAKAWRQATMYRRAMADSHSAADRFDPAWIRWFVVAMGACVATWLAFDLSAALLGGISYVDNYWLYVGIGSVFLWMSFEALMRCDWVFPAAEQVVRRSPSRSDDQYADPNVIRDAIKTAGWHRNQSLTVGKLAQLMGTNQSYLSRGINASGENFNRFINRIRVEEVCGRLSDSKAGLLDLALEAGFTSKATFNRAFKAMTGKTPSQWRAAERLKS